MSMKSENVLHVENGLEPFWDEHLVDLRYTDAVLSSNRPDRMENVMVLDKPWERGCSYYSIVKDDNCYRMYITKLLGAYDESHKCWIDVGGIISYAESQDGIQWERPVLGLCEFKGSKENNIILRSYPPAYELYNVQIDGYPTDACDAFAVFIDENPACPPEERYKGVMRCGAYRPEGFTDPYEEGKATPGKLSEQSLVCYASADGIHFKKHSVVTKGTGVYDSLNTVCWNPHTQKYYCFMRSHHIKDDNLEPNYQESFVRDVAVVESEDFVHWSEARSLDYLGGADYPMYTNCAMSYLHDRRYFVAFPTRYVERRDWESNPNFERLCGREERYKASLQERRNGVALTDCVFMSSRDGFHWRRFDEACITGGPERLGGAWRNWRYGDAYPAWGMLKTPSRVNGAQPELSLLVPEVYEGAGIYADTAGSYTETAGVAYELVRYVYRKDGFASYKAGYQPKTLRTKPFTFDGNTLRMNFRTSARGGIYLRILDERSLPIEGYSTYEIFGDNVERIVEFEKPLGELKGQVVSFEFIMRDAEIYALHFADE